MWTRLPRYRGSRHGTDRSAASTGTRRRRIASVVAAMAAITLTAACGSGGSNTTVDATNNRAAATTNPDDGTRLTMWVPTETGEFSKRLVAAYNASHKNHIVLTIKWGPVS